MKKEILQLSLAAVVGCPTALLAQNTFPLPSGSVGIGTDHPHAQLEVLQRNPSEQAVLDVVKAAGGANDPIMRVWRDNGLNTDGTYVANNIAMTVLRSGNVGLGTASPQAKLNVVRTGSLNLNPGENPLLGLNYAYGFRVSGPSDDNLNLDYYSSDHWHQAFTLSRVTGNVGFGTVNPTAAVDILGANQSLLDLTIGAGDLATTPVFRIFGDTPKAALKFQVLRSGNVTVNGQLAVASKLSCQTLELTSDPNQKQGFQSISSSDVLAKVVGLPLTTWAYTNAPTVRHIGPMAPDFRKTFNLGDDDTHIGAGDGIGVALAAIQGLHQVVRQKDSEIEELRQQISSLKRDLSSARDAVSDRLAALERAAARGGVQAAGYHPEAR